MAKAKMTIEDMMNVVADETEKLRNPATTIDQKLQYCKISSVIANNAKVYMIGAATLTRAKEHGLTNNDCEAIFGGSR